MIFAELFAGIGGFRIGLERTGMRCGFACEIDKRARKCYAAHFDTNEFAKDIRGVERLPDCDLLCGGWPCQDLSLAKNDRKGLSGERSGLFYEIIRLLESASRKPKWIMLENVPGLLTAERGLAMRNVIDELCKCGYCLQWRTLNARYFRIAQQRRRVFVVGNLGTEPAAEILFESKTSKGSYPAGEKAKTDVAFALTRETGGISGKSNQITSIAEPLTRSNARNCDWPNSNLVAGTLSKKWSKGTGGPSGDECQNLVEAQGIRRLTPLECERCQGFPDGWTEMLSATQRYNCLGNAVAVPVVEWIGRRIIEHENGS